MEAKTIKGLIIAGSAAVVALGGAIGGTYALFSRTADTTVHVKVGNLNFKFERTQLLSRELDSSTGYLTDHTDTTVVDLTASGAKAMDVANAAPGASYTGTFVLTNTGSTAFEVSVALNNAKVTNEAGADVASTNSVWANTSVAIHTEGQEDKTMKLNNLSSASLPNVIKGAALTFTVKVALGNAIDNDGQGANLSFAVVLTATQAIAA